MTDARRILILLGLTLVGGCRSEQEPQPASPAVEVDVAVSTVDSSENSRQPAVSTRLQQGIAALENGDLPQAEQQLSALAKELQQSKVVARNLAVVRVLAAASPSQSGEQMHPRPVSHALEALDRFESLTGTASDKADVAVLRARLLVSGGLRDQDTAAQVRKKLEAALQADPLRHDVRLALVELLQQDEAQKDVTLPLQHLKQLTEAIPDNLFAHTQLLEQAATLLRSPHDAVRELAEQAVLRGLTGIRPLVEPLHPTIARHGQIDLLARIEETIQAPPAAEQLIRTAMVVANTLRPESATQIDRRRLRRHPLDYVVHRLNQQVPSDADSRTSPGTSLSFRSETPFDWSGASDFQIADLNLDGRTDLLALVDGQLHFESFVGPDQESRPAVPEFQVSLPNQSWEHLILLDIDRDYQRTASAGNRPHVLRDADGDRHITTQQDSSDAWFDTDLDVVVWSDSQLQILENQQQEDGTRRLAVVQTHVMTNIQSVVAADLDADGDLDLVLAAELGLTGLVNTDGRVFVEQHLSSETGACLVAGDVDRNVAVDIVAATSSGPGLLQNLFHRRFRWQPASAVFGPAAGTEFVQLADLDGNLSWDVVCGGSDGLSLQLTRTRAPGVTSPWQQVSLSQHPVQALALSDINNDGWQDIVTVAEDRLTVRTGGRDPEMMDEAGAWPLSAGCRCLRTNDVDQDGRPDILLLDQTGRLQWWKNETATTHPWFKLVARGHGDSEQFRSLRVNMHGIGTVVEILADGHWQTQVVTEPITHFGLGSARQIDAVRLVWPNGVPQNITDADFLKPNSVVLAPQILKGSCPYIYTWTGSQFEFFSDCLWSAPIGLVQASGDLAPTRDWENLLIPGNQLRQHEGKYWLQITEELWEIAYFDEIQLTAIDHPADVQVFTNEKVGPPDLAQHRVHTVQQPVLPVSVTDGQGHNLLPQLRQQDGDYVRPFTKRHLQGLTDEWTIEFDLGDSLTSDNIRLFLIGWIFPTDTSLNQYIEQHPDVAAPAPPVIEVPDNSGQWRTVRPFIGFPSGKTKAMVVDLSGVAGPKNSRFRLRSTMELYFDQAFFAVGEEDVDVATQPCMLTSADLHFRGFSRRRYDGSVFREGFAPEGYDYQQTTTGPRWPPIAGRFTRYGEATDLLQRGDDQLVVMGPGDEMTLCFAVPERPLPPGWRRDFVLRNVGWDKDADLNTVYGQSSEPYPFRAMTRYPFAADEQPPMSIEHSEYLRTRQTRRYSPFPFWNLLHNQ